MAPPYPPNVQHVVTVEHLQNIFNGCDAQKTAIYTQLGILPKILLQRHVKRQENDSNSPVCFDFE